MHTQIISSYICDFLRCYRRAVPCRALPPPIRGLVEQSLGQPVDTMFRTFEDQPLGAASIGQVHRAIMKDGRKAVVKVCRYSNCRLFFAR